MSALLHSPKFWVLCFLFNIFVSICIERKYRNGVRNTVEDNSSVCFIPECTSCHLQGHAGSETLLQENPPVPRWECCGPISLCLDSFLYCVLLYVVCMLRFVTRWGGPGGIEAYPWEHYFLHCFDTVGWVIWPAKTVPEMTYNVFSGTLNPTHFTSRLMQVSCITWL